MKILAMHNQHSDVNSLLSNVLLLSVPKCSYQIAPYSKAISKRDKKLEATTKAVLEALLSNAPQKNDSLIKKSLVKM